MRLSRNALQGRGGWGAVAGLATALAVLVAGQLPATADGAALSPVGAALRVLAPSGPPAPAEQPAAVAAGQQDAVRALRPAQPSAPAPAAARVAGTPAAPPAAAAQPPAPPAAAAKPAAARKPAAPPPSACSGAGWQQRRGRAALASLKGGAERTGFRVAFAGARKGYLGLTHLDERRIDVFVRACDAQSDELLRHVVAHELGHAYDTTRMTAATRRQWMAVRGIPTSTDWYGCSGCTDFATPAGDFAEVYAQWARGTSTNRSELAGDVPAGQLAQLATRFFGA